MSMFRNVILMAALIVSVTSHASIKRGTSSAGKNSARISAEKSSAKLLVPTRKNPDPALALGLGHNPAECAFKSQLAKNDTSTGIVYGKTNSANNTKADGVN